MDHFAEKSTNKSMAWYTPGMQAAWQRAVGTQAWARLWRAWFTQLGNEELMKDLSTTAAIGSHLCFRKFTL